MAYIIGGVGIVMLLILFYCAIAILYYYIKKFISKLKELRNLQSILYNNYIFGNK